MNIAIFNKKYLIRRFGEQRIVKGYATSYHEDFIANLNVHSSGNVSYTLPEGERKVKRLEAHGTDVLRAADYETGTKGDLLYYHGDWYECVSAVEYDHTILSHWNYEFVIVPKDASGTVDAYYDTDTGEGEEYESE